MDSKSSEIIPIETDNATAAGGHYSQAVAFQGLIFVSGQLGFPPGSTVPTVGSVEEQTKNCLENLRRMFERSARRGVPDKCKNKKGRSPRTKR